MAQFDRGHYRFHGRIAALARAATKAGLVCTGLEVKKKHEHAPPPADAKAKKEGGGEKKDKGKTQAPGLEAGRRGEKEKRPRRPRSNRRQTNHLAPTLCVGTLTSDAPRRG